MRGRIDPRGGRIDEPNPLARVQRREREGHVLGIAQAEREPDQRRDEGEVGPGIEHHDLVAVTDPLAQLERGGQPRETGTDDHDSLAIGHSVLSLAGRSRVGTRRHNGTVVRV
jgi:hypothetical protein